jgi:hypothetical protein
MGTVDGRYPAAVTLVIVKEQPQLLTIILLETDLATPVAAATVVLYVN